MSTGTESSDRDLDRRTQAPIAVGILGAGYISEFHASVLARMPGVRVVAVCDTSLERAQALARRFKDAKAVRSLDELLGEPRPAVVHNLLPAHLHFESTQEILSRGIGVLLEKPLAIASAQCAELERIAKANTCVLGVSHNFLSSPPFLRLCQDFELGRLGRPENITVVWDKELPQLAAGSTDAWMFQSPRNVLFEIAPHLFAALIRLAGVPTSITTLADDPVRLSRDRLFFRRWRFTGNCGACAFDLRMSFRPGFPAHAVLFRGAASSASADLERGTYVRHRSRPLQMDVDRFAGGLAEGFQFAWQGSAVLKSVVLGKAGVAFQGGPFAVSIVNSVWRFYQDLHHLPQGHTAAFGTSVIESIEKAAAEIPGAETPLRPLSRLTGPVDALVLGATGFIGQRLVRRLVADGLRVRVLGRSRSKLDVFEGLPVDIVQGDIESSDLSALLSSVAVVYDLAKGSGVLREEWDRTEVAVCRRVAEACTAMAVQRLVYASTIAIYDAGRAGRVIDESTPPGPEIVDFSLYAAAKASCEAVLRDLARSAGLKAVIVRPGIVLGDGGPVRHGGVAQFMGTNAVVVPGRGDLPLPMVLVDDVVDALVRCGTTPGIDGHSFNLVGDVRLTALDYLAILEQHQGIRLDRYGRSIARTWIAEVAQWMVKVMIRHHNTRFPHRAFLRSQTFASRFDNSAAKSRLGWRPEVDRDAFIERGILAPLRKESV